MYTTIEQVAADLPSDLVRVLAAGGYAKVAAEVFELPGGLTETALYTKVGMDLMSRLQERRRIVKGLLHLTELGA